LAVYRHRESLNRRPARVRDLQLFDRDVKELRNAGGERFGISVALSRNPEGPWRRRAARRAAPSGDRLQGRPLLRDPFALDVLNFADVDAELSGNLDAGLVGGAALVLQLDQRPKDLFPLFFPQGFNHRYASRF
jgi:hypothetical protein